jgi:hypothetical protein
LGYKKPEMKPSTVVANLVIASSVFISNVSASVIIDYITVGNVGNAADATGYGAVGYQYQIGKYEVTNAQYAEFLNAKAKTNNYGLYNSNMASYGITQSGGSGNFTCLPEPVPLILLPPLRGQLPFHSLACSTGALRTGWRSCSRRTGVRRW